MIKKYLYIIGSSVVVFVLGLIKYLTFMNKKQRTKIEQLQKEKVLQKEVLLEEIKIQKHKIKTEAEYKRMIELDKKVEDDVQKQIDNSGGNYTIYKL
jgi:hypothetical protein